jgi:hypothetical protein
MRRFGRLFAAEAIARKKELGPGGVTMLAALAVLMTLAYSGCTDSSNAPSFRNITPWW